MDRLQPQKIEFASLPETSADPGIGDRETHVQGVRWGLTEYAPGAGREDWCDAPHVCYLLSGSMTYEFDDGRPPLTVKAGEGLALPPSPRHRGRNEGDEPARIFVIDSLPSAE